MDKETTKEEEKFKWPRLWSPSKFSPAPASRLPEHKYRIPDTAPKGIFQIYMEEHPYQSTGVFLGGLWLIYKFIKKY